MTSRPRIHLQHIQRFVPFIHFLSLNVTISFSFPFLIRSSHHSVFSFIAHPLLLQSSSSFFLFLLHISFSFLRFKNTLFHLCMHVHKPTQKYKRRPRFLRSIAMNNNNTPSLHLREKDDLYSTEKDLTCS